VKLTFAVENAVTRYVSGSYVPTLTIPGTWQVMDARRVTNSRQWDQACQSITNAAMQLKVLTGPKTCPKH